jgi:MoxR-like ATPase
MACARVRALLDGRVAVAIEDIQQAAAVVLRHRMVLGFEAEARGLEADHFIEQALAATPVE